MRKLNQSGSLLAPLVIVSALLLSSIGFGAWAFMSRQDYKNNSDKKVAVAVAQAKTEESVKKDAEFVEAEKSPLKTYVASETFGSLSFQYPKIWSAYISEAGKSSTQLDGYFHPQYVPDVASTTAFALRIQIVNTSYEQTLKLLDSSVKAGKVKVSAYRPPKVESVLGSRMEGEIASKKQGTMVLLPLRDKTIKVWTENSEFLNDFNATILTSLTFAP